MSNKKGFTLVEIIVVMVIVGFLAAISIPNYLTSMQQGAATAAKNNLISIYNGQKAYYLSSTGNGTYYSSGSANDLAGINAAFGLSMTDTYFQYTCALAGTSYTCTATNTAGSGVTLTLTGANQIISEGGAGCANFAGGGCNPGCAPNNSPNCPNN